MSIFVVGFITPSAFAQEIPEWVKNNVAWWADGVIGDQEFVRGIQFLINEGILVVSPTTISDEKTDEIPEWVKNNGKWWTEGIISDSEFLNNIQYLIANGILVVQVGSEMEKISEAYTISGQFHDADFFHKTSGVATIEYTDDSGGTLNFDQEFTTVSGPDLYVYLSTDKNASDFVNIGKLQSFNGEQTYELPSDVDLEKYDNVLVWCKAFGVLFGNASLS